MAFAQYPGLNHPATHVTTQVIEEALIPGPCPGRATRARPCTPPGPGTAATRRSSRRTTCANASSACEAIQQCHRTLRLAVNYMQPLANQNVRGKCQPSASQAGTVCRCEGPAEVGPYLRYIFSSIGTAGSFEGTFDPSRRAWPAVAMT